MSQLKVKSTMDSVNTPKLKIKSFKFNNSNIIVDLCFGNTIDEGEIIVSVSIKKENIPLDELIEKATVKARYFISSIQN